jgi:hypothetical protein
MKCPFKKNVTFKRDETGRIIGKSEKFGECDKEKCPFFVEYTDNGVIRWCCARNAS